MIRNFNLASGATEYLPGGYHIQILETSQPVTVVRLGDRRRELEKAENVPASWGYEQPIWTDDPVTKEIRITAGPLGAVGRISISEGRSGINAISGVVEVADGARFVVDDERAFAAQIYQVAVPAVYSFTQLYNPVGSGVRLVVEVIGAGSDVAQTVGFGRGLAGLTNELVGSAGPTNKKGAGVATKAESRYETNATLNPAGIEFYTVATLQAADSKRFTLAKPIILPEGDGLVMRSGVVNSRVDMTVEYFEELA